VLRQQEVDDTDDELDENREKLTAFPVGRPETRNWWRCRVARRATVRELDVIA
jgi:hypothetical protein